MQKSHAKKYHLSLEIRRNKNTMAEELIKANKDCQVSHRFGEQAWRSFR